MSDIDKLKEVAEKARDRPDSDDWNPVSEFEWEASPLTILALIERVEIAEADLRLVLRADVTRLKAAETAYREESA